MQDVTLGGTGARFNDTLNAGASDIDLNITGSARFVGDVGMVNPLATLDVTGAVNFDTTHIRTTGAQTYRSAANVLDDTTLHTTRATFADNVDAASAGSHSLTIQGDATFNGESATTAHSKRFTSPAIHKSMAAWSKPPASRCTKTPSPSATMRCLPAAISSPCKAPPTASTP